MYRKKISEKNDLQNIHKTKDRVTRTPLKTGENSGTPEGWAVPAPLVAPVVLIRLLFGIDTSTSLGHIVITYIC
jgi:hypothetical protein